MKIVLKPQILTAMALIAVIAIVVILRVPQHVVQIAGSAITGIGMLGMKLLEKE